jgi:hypothetical protein
VEHEFTERRRSPRVATTNGTMVIRPVSVRVRLPVRTTPARQVVQIIQ